MPLRAAQCTVGKYSGTMPTSPKPICAACSSSWLRLASSNSASACFSTASNSGFE
jgi:hypothetical protein